MTDATTHMKWFYRCMLLAATGLVSYVAILPQYNFAHWVPHSFLRSLGVSYDALLMFESHADKLLHPVTAFLLVLLISKAEIPEFSWPLHRPLLLVTAAILAAEAVQYQVGRGIEVADILLGLSGALLAFYYLFRRQRVR